MIGARAARQHADRQGRRGRADRAGDGGARPSSGSAARANELISSFSYGHQRLIEIAARSAANPALLLLDEPAAGLNSTEKLELHELLKRIAAQGLTISDHRSRHDAGARSSTAHHRAQFRKAHCRWRIAGGAAAIPTSSPPISRRDDGAARDQRPRSCATAKSTALRGVTLQGGGRGRW